MRKLSFILAVIMLFSMTAVFAEESLVTKAEVVTLNEFFENADKLIYTEANGRSVKVTAKNGVYERDFASGKAESPEAPVFSTDKKYLNEIFSVDMEFDFFDGENKDSFNGFQLRAKENNKLCWTTNCYVIIVKKDRVEIQSFFNGDNKYHLNTSAVIPENEKVNVKYGAVDTEKGTYIFLKIGDTVYSALDTNSTIKDSGYMNIEWRSKFKAFKTKADGISLPVSMISYDPLTSSVTEELVYVNGGDEKNAEITERKWYFSGKDLNPDLQQRFGKTFEDLFTVIDGETRESLMVMPGDIGLYTMNEIKTDKGLVIRSDEEYISSAEYLLAKGYAGVLDCGTMFANGKYLPYDEGNSAVTPIEENGQIYVPVRAVSEAYDIPVGWNPETRCVWVDSKKETGDINDMLTYDSCFKIGDVSWAKFRLLMGGGIMTASPIIYEDRSMLVYRDFAALLDFKNVIWDEKTGLIAYSDVPLTFTEADKAHIVDYVMYGPLK